MRHTTIPTTAALALVVAGCAGAGGDADPDLAATTLPPATSAAADPAPTTSTVPTPEATVATSAATVPPAPTLPGADPVAADAALPEPDSQEMLRARYRYLLNGIPGRIESELGFAPLRLDAGTYETDAMWTPLTFTTPVPIRLVSERRTFLVLVDDDARALWDTPIAHVMRPHRLVDPAASTVGPPDWPPTVDGWDLDAWFAAQPGIEVERTPLQVDGISAVRYDVTIPSDGTVGWELDTDVWVVPLVWRYGQGPHDLPSVDRHRIWLIPQGEHAPILIHAAVPADEEWGDFGDELDAIVASFQLGDPEPVGLPDQLWEAGLPGPVPAGTVRLPILDGVEFELAGDAFVNQHRGWALFDILGVPYDFYPPNVEVAVAATTIDGAPIASADELADLLVDLAGASRLPDGRVAGRDAAVVVMEGVQPGIPVFRHVDVPPLPDPGFAAWYTQDYVELWAIDTDAGVLILTAEAEDPDGLEVAREWLEQIRATIVID